MDEPRPGEEHQEEALLLDEEVLDGGSGPWEEEAATAARKEAERDLIAQMFLRFGEWPLLSPEEERSLLASYLISRRELSFLAEALGLTEEEVALGIRKRALGAMGLGVGSGGITERDLPKPLRRAYQAVYEGEQARARLILSNARLVVKLAKGHAAKWPSVPLEDLIQEGFTGLFKAIDRFDLRLNTKLSTYASWWIRDALNKGVRKHLFAQRMAFAEGEESHLVSVLSIDEPVGEDGDRFADFIPSPKEGIAEALEGEEARQQGEALLNALLGELDPRDAYVLASRYGLLGLKREGYEELAARLGVTKTRVRQIEAKALHRLAKIAQSRLGVSPDLEALLGFAPEATEEEENGEEE